MCPVLRSAFTPSLNPVLGKRAVGPLINVTLPVLPNPPLLLHLSRLSPVLVLLAVSFLLLTRSLDSFTFFLFLSSLTSFSIAPALSSLSPSLSPPIFHNYLYFLFPLSRQLTPLISLPVSFPHVYLALSLSLVVSSLGKLKRCEEGNKSKSKNAFRG